jgi:hypothetical protein
MNVKKNNNVHGRLSEDACLYDRYPIPMMIVHDAREYGSRQHKANLNLCR